MRHLCRKRKFVFLDINLEKKHHFYTQIKTKLYFPNETFVVCYRSLKKISALNAYFTEIT